MLLFFVISSFTIQLAIAIPPLNGGPEPDWPDGMNTPSERALNRDDADLEGEWNCLIILIDFDDYPWDFQDDTLFNNEGNPYTSEHFEEMLFSDQEYVHPGSESDYTGSMRDYYNEVSQEMFTVTGVVTRWYRAPRPYTYYCNADGEFGTDDDYGRGNYPANSQGLAEQAVNLARDDVDFSDFDNDGNELVDALFIVHSGPGAEMFGRNAIGANYIWSHKWQFPQMEVDGVVVSTYAMQPESGAISVFCHEFGHLLGLPDLYDIDGSSEGIGEWSLMAGGGWCYRAGDAPGTCPSHMDGWSKIQLGWVDIRDVTEEIQNVEIPPVENSGTIYRVYPRGNRNSEEYFLLENRRRIGFDSGLIRRQIRYNLDAPEGLLISHIDNDLWQGRNDANANENHRLVDIEEASPVWVEDNPIENLDLERGSDWDTLRVGNRGDNGDLWPGFSQINEHGTDWIGDRELTVFGPESIPSSQLYGGQFSRVNISDIRLGDDNSVICNIDPNYVNTYLEIKKWIISDVDGGNGNHFIESDETINLDIQLLNSGGISETDITATISHDDGLIEIITERADFPDIEIDEISESQTSFQFKISEGVDLVNTVNLTVRIVSDEGQWEYPLKIQLLKYAGNPVLGRDPEGWNSLGVRSPSILIEDDQIKCWYAGSSKVGLAYSDDGGETWEREEEPVLDVRFGSVSDVSVIRHDGEYLMVVIIANGGAMNGLHNGAIYQARSENGIDWELDGHPVSLGDEQDPFYVLGYSQLSLYENDNAVYLAFSIFRFPALQTSIITIVTEDHENWELTNTTLVRPNGDVSNFDGGEVYSPSVNFVNGQHALLYGGIRERGHGEYIFDHAGRLGILTSEDGNSFERFEGLLTGGSSLEPDDQVDWEEVFIFSGSIFEWNGQYRVLYAAADSVNRYDVFDNSSAIGLASGITFDPPNSAPENNNILPAAFYIDPAYPNPFNARISIPFHLVNSAKVKFSVYNSNGKELAILYNAVVNPGYHQVNWDASQVATGIYFLRAEGEWMEATQKLALIR